MRRTAVSLGLLAATWIATSLAIAQPVRERVLLRATSVLPDAVQTELHALAEPVRREVPANAPVEALLRAFCGGSISDIYAAQFAELNQNSQVPPLRAVAQARRMLFPACPQVQREKASALVGETDISSLEFILRRRLGATMATRLLVCNAGRSGPCRVVTVGERMQELRPGLIPAPLNVPVGTVLEIPATSSWTTVTLRQGRKAAEAVTRLEAAAAASPAGADLLRVQRAPEMQLIAPQQSANPEADGAGCIPEALNAPDWPFNREAVVKAIDDARVQRGLLWPTVTPTVVRIADTGVTGLGDPERFPLSMLAVNGNERPDNENDADRNDFIGDYFGINSENLGDVRPLPNHLSGAHGTQVADLALGGHGFRQNYRAIGELIRLNFARVFTDNGAGHITVKTEMLHSSLRASPPDVDIVNFSIGGEEPTTALRDALELLSRSRQLVVMAAGNDGRQIGEGWSYFPIGYASRPNIRPYVIVVGAHGPVTMVDGRARAERTGTSNYGAGYVDLLAPGCRLPLPFPAEGPPVLSGTSMAAPLVSFTAALLRHLLPPPVDQKHIRDRIWASTRWVSPEIAAVTGFGGILDVAAALRAFDDVVRAPDGKLTYGLWKFPKDGTFELCASRDPMLAANILRVRTETPTDGGLPLLWVLSRDTMGLVSEASAPCRAANEEGPTLQLENDETKTVRWRDVAAFIPAFNLSIRRSSQPFAPAPVALPAPVLGTRSPQVVAIQGALNSLGFPAGVEDGVFGAATRQAVVAFQQRRNELPTGLPTQAQIGILLRAAKDGK